MEIPTREQLERRLHAIVADHLDALAETHPDGFDLGVVAIAVEVLYPDEQGAAFLRREEGGYTPPIDVESQWSYYCSDHRWWVKEAVFKEAHDYFAYPPDEHHGDEDDESERPDDG
ncbi:MAG: hypothetical protein M3321_10485 [Actinomycetota bacterium]|nr:hypothetical protein [Actinomycetota bacterium]